MTKGERISNLRKLKGMSMVELADRVGILKQTMYKYENDVTTNVPSDKIELIADALGVSPSVIMGWEDKKNGTFGEDLDLWEKDKYGDDGISHNYASAKKHLAPIFRRKIADLKTIDLENTIMMDGIPRTMRQRVKIMITQVYDYAMRHEIVTKDYSALIRVSIDLSVKHEKTVFTASEVKKVWNSEQEPLREITLILLYTGMRINELLTMTADSVKDGYIVAGSKSEAGKNRVIPIHPEIADIIARLTKKHKGKLFHMTPITVRKNMVNAYGHIPHECRHSFATQAMECGMNDEARKRILGHASVGVTNQVYTHLDIEFLKSEMKKLKY